MGNSSPLRSGWLATIDQTLWPGGDLRKTHPDPRSSEEVRRQLLTFSALTRAIARYSLGHQSVSVFGGSRCWRPSDNKVRGAACSGPGPNTGRDTRGGEDGPVAGRLHGVAKRKLD